MKTKMLSKIIKYSPVNEQEILDKQIIVNFLKNNDDAYLRDNKLAHMTASAWIVNSEKTKVLMCYHKIYNSWSWLGGHADGESDLLFVAIREAKEESGLINITPVVEDIFSLEILTVDGHEKKGKYVPSHLHMNVTFLLEADEEDLLRIKEDENLGLQWFTFEECIQASTEPWMVEKVYNKLIAKIELGKCNSI